MNNNENNIPEKNDFEIIDIPTENNGINQQQNVNIENQSNNIVGQSFNEMPPFQSNNNTEMSSTNINNNEIPPFQPNNSVEMNSANINNNGISNISNVEMTDSLNNDQSSLANDSNRETIYSSDAKNVYIPKNNVNGNNDLENKKMDKGTKEMIILAILAALVIIFLPFLYNLSSGKYHIIDKVKKLYEKSPKTEEKVVEEKEEEEEIEDDDEEENIEQIEFDYSKYNNKLINNDGLKELLITYKNNVLSLIPTNENGIDKYNIEIDKNVRSEDEKTGIDVETFNNENLNNQANYLITVTESDSIITVTAVKQ